MQKQCLIIQNDSSCVSVSQLLTEVVHLHLLPWMLKCTWRCRSMFGYLASYAQVSSMFLLLASTCVQCEPLLSHQAGNALLSFWRARLTPRGHFWAARHSGNNKTTSACQHRDPCEHAMLHRQTRSSYDCPTRSDPTILLLRNDEMEYAPWPSPRI